MRLSAAIKADDGILLGVKAAKIPTLLAAGFVDVLRKINQALDSSTLVVDARWGKEAVELCGRVREYTMVVEKRLETGN